MHASGRLFFIINLHQLETQSKIEVKRHNEFGVVATVTNVGSDDNL